MSESDKSGKPELSNDELTRISKEAYSRYTGYDGTAMSIGFRQGAEWGILHERSAAQGADSRTGSGLQFSNNKNLCCFTPCAWGGRFHSRRHC